MLCLSQGVQCRTLQGHAHWVNTLALSTDYVLRTGAFEPANATINAQDLKGSCMSAHQIRGTYTCSTGSVLLSVFWNCLDYIFHLMFTVEEIKEKALERYNKVRVRVYFLFYLISPSLYVYTI